MTHTTSLHAADTVDPPSRRTKSVLFCPNCGHESPHDGDWLRDSDQRADGCPECHAPIGAGRRPADD